MIGQVKEMEILFEGVIQTLTSVIDGNELRLHSWAKMEKYMQNKLSRSERWTLKPESLACICCNKTIADVTKYSVSRNVQEFFSM